MFPSELCQPIPHPHDWFDWLGVTKLTHQNAMRWHNEPRLTAWLDSAHLNWFGTLQSTVLAHIEQGPEASVALGSQDLELGQET
jgi:hypothetical protein